MQFAFVLIALCQFCCGKLTENEKTFCYFCLGAAESLVAVKYQRVERQNQFHPRERTEIVDLLILQSIKQKHFQQFSFNSTSTCKAIDLKEGKEEPCTFKGAQYPIEIVEHEFVYKYIQSSDVVLELNDVRDSLHAKELWQGRCNRARP